MKELWKKLNDKHEVMSVHLRPVLVVVFIIGALATIGLWRLTGATSYRSVLEVPKGYYSQPLDGFIVMPVIFPDHTTISEDVAVMVGLEEKLEKGNTSYLLLGCVDRGDWYECNGAMKVR